MILLFHYWSNTRVDSLREPLSSYILSTKLCLSCSSQLWTNKALWLYFWLVQETRTSSRRTHHNVLLQCNVFISNTLHENMYNCVEYSSCRCWGLHALGYCILPALSKLCIGFKYKLVACLKARSYIRLSLEGRKRWDESECLYVPLLQQACWENVGDTSKTCRRAAWNADSHHWFDPKV